MKREIPTLFNNIGYLDKPLDYKWSEKKAQQSISEQVINDKLLDLMCQLNHKAAFGFGAAAAEWIFWRFLNWRPKHSGRDLIKAFISNDVHWVGLINKYYLTDWTNRADYDDLPEDNIEKPLWIAVDLIEYARFNYLKSRPTLYGNVTRLLTLARHLSTEEKLFDQWFKTCYKQAQKRFPNQQWPVGEELTRDNINNDYDSNDDPFIPREFYFTQGFDYDGADLIKMQQDLLASADYEQNTFFRSPKMMLKAGFKGQPYQLSTDE